MKAKKSFGQHFLIDETLAYNIANGFNKVKEIQNVLEIGPGKGMLTKYLLNQNINLMVVEADRDMIEYLERKYLHLKNRIIFLDFLKIDLKKVFNTQQCYIIGNFPYNISSQIIFKIIENKELVPEMIGMFQKEVAERLASNEGSKVYGAISVLTQAHYHVSITYRVKPSAFSPPPKVESAVIHLKRKENFELNTNKSLFKQVVKLSFNQRRKMLRNTLKPLIGKTAILQNEIFTKRPEQLSLVEFVNLTNLIITNSQK